MAEKLVGCVGKYGAFSTLDEDADGYYIIKFTSEPYTLQEDRMLTEFTPAIKVKAGELVCDAEYYNKVAGAQLWYTPMEGEARETLARVQQVIAADLALAPISEENKLPPGMNKKKKAEATKKKAVRVDPKEHEVMLDEISRREALEFDEEGEESEDDSEDEESSDEEEGEEDA